jgi:hypothetical protein
MVDLRVVGFGAMKGVRWIWPDSPGGCGSGPGPGGPLPDTQRTGLLELVPGSAGTALERVQELIDMKHDERDRNDNHQKHQRDGHERPGCRA